MRSRTCGIVIPQLCGVGFLLTLIFLVGFEFARANVIVNDVQFSMHNAVNASVTENDYDAYDSIREGLPGAYAIDNNGQAHDNSYVDSQQRVISSLALKDGNGGGYVKMNGVQSDYTISGLSVQLNNPSAGTAGTFSETISCNLSISMPLLLPPVTIPLSVGADFASKF